MSYRPLALLVRAHSEERSGANLWNSVTLGPGRLSGPFGSGSTFGRSTKSSNHSVKRTRSRVRSGAKASIRKEITAPRASEAVRYARGITAWGQPFDRAKPVVRSDQLRMLRLLAPLLLIWVAAQDVTPPPGAVLLDLELTVDNTPTRLRLHQDQSFLDAARQACTPTETPEAKDNCVGGAMSIIVNQHLRASTVHKSKLAALSTRPRCSHRATWPARPHRRRERQHPSHWLICTQAAKDGQAADATALASPGVSLVRDELEKYDPVSWVGQSPLHVDIELPIQVKRTVCDAERCFELR